VSFPGFELPSVGDFSVPEIGEIAPRDASQALHHVTLVMPNGEEIKDLRGDNRVLQEMERAARDSENYSIGRKPSWYRGK
jgi:hypothetical protein